MIAYTLDSLRAAIDEWLENDFWGDTDQKDNIISMSEEKIYKTVGIAGFNTTTFGLTFNAGVGIPTTPLPSRLTAESPVTPISMRLPADGNGYSSYLLLKDLNFCQEYYGSTTGTPKVYAFYNNEADNYNPYVTIFPRPDTNYTVANPVVFQYFYKPESITEITGTASTWLSTFGQEALLYACITNAYTFMKGDADLINLYDTKFKEALQALVFEQGGSFRNPAYNEKDVPNRSMVNQ